MAFHLSKIIFYWKSDHESLGYGHWAPCSWIQSKHQNQFQQTVSSILDVFISSAQISWSTLATRASASSICRSISFLWILICSMSSWEYSWDSNINCFSSFFDLISFKSTTTQGKHKNYIYASCTYIYMYKDMILFCITIIHIYHFYYTHILLYYL